MTPDELAEGLLDATLPQAEWRHAGHLTAAYALVTRFGPEHTVRLCRACIPPLNAAHGVANSAVGGYHETLTICFVSAVADAIARGRTLGEILASLDRDIPFRWWSRELLLSSDARRQWVAPDRAPLPFPAWQGAVVTR